MKQPVSDEFAQSIAELGRCLSDATLLMHEAISRKAGLSGTDHKYLGCLLQHGAMTAGDLSKLTGLTTGAITGLVDRLADKQLVRRQFDPSDRRKVVIVPDTELAEKLLGNESNSFRASIVNLMSTFEEHEIETIKRYLLSAIELMKTRTTRLNND